MLSEFAVGGVYLPPFFVYACVSVPLFLLLRGVLVRAGILRRVWHPALFEFAVSLGLVSALVLFL